ncbi:MAG: ATP-binding cassette domain-containing protein, partial [Saprospiraceae bacterium]|nr:ATP-binding cassette domain-containing protein [Saprospiraceae bacterium]
DYKRFDQAAENQGKLIELIGGMQEIKLHNAETQKRWEWERTEAKLFRVGMRYLAVDQRQRLGAQLLNELKNILIIVFAAKAVIEGSLTIGVLLAVMYILGQLNAPINQLVEFIKSAQDAKISLERMNEIHQRENEENPAEKITILPEVGDLRLEGVSFQYGGPGSPLILKELDLTFPKGKTTAVVGSSGSGKTTLLKLLLNIYQPTEGAIKLGDINLNNFQSRLWRSKCGSVLQDGYLFSDSIARNIGLGDEIVDDQRLFYATRMANIQSFIESLPLGYNTRIGADGVGLSQGQKQRILIARAIYKDPEFLFFDEATNALDAYNEMVIMENLAEFLSRKTLVIVAHRLSTVMNADQIIVLENGEVVERGTHEYLSRQQGAYYHLLRNQLELGS